jgi:hypothetical protein
MDFVGLTNWHNFRIDDEKYWNATLIRDHN